MNVSPSHFKAIYSLCRFSFVVSLAHIFTLSEYLLQFLFPVHNWTLSQLSLIKSIVNYTFYQKYWPTLICCKQFGKKQTSYSTTVRPKTVLFFASLFLSSSLSSLISTPHPLFSSHSGKKSLIYVLEVRACSQSKVSWIVSIYSGLFWYWKIPPGAEEYKQIGCC